MILAAGRGERMRPLTDKLPKPLLNVNNKPLIEYHIEKLAARGIDNIVINHAWLGHLIPEQLGKGQHWGVDLHYSNEGDNALETAGGIKKALSVIKTDYFVVVNGDVWSDFDFAMLPSSLPRGIKAHLILVNNPDHNPKGDFAIEGELLTNHGESSYTFSGIAIYHRSFFDGVESGKNALGPVIRQHIQDGEVSGELYQGKWFDIGTPQRLEELNQLIKTMGL